MSSNKQEIIEHQGRTGEGARPLSGGGGLVRLGRSGGGGREGSPGLVLPRQPKRGLGAGSVVMVEEQAAGVGILLQISMLVLSFVLGHILRRRKFYYIPEASGSLLIGAYAYPVRHLDPRSFVC